MKFILILSLLLTIFAGTCIPGASARATPTHFGPEFGPASSQVLQVWFDAAPQLTTLYPEAYLFNVAAKTAPGLTITSLFWNFGDGSNLSVPFSSQSQVSDIRAHQYAGQGNYCVTVTAYDSAGNTATVSTSLKPNYDFTLNASPATQNVTQGGAASYSVIVGSSPASCGVPVHVNLVVSTAPPQGTTWSLNPSSGNTSFTSTLQVQTAVSTPQGTYAINVVGTSANVTHSVTVSLVITAPYFTIPVAPNSLFVPTQTTGDRTNSTTVTIQSFNGFSNPVTLSVNGEPNGMTVSFSNPNPGPPPNGMVTSILTIITPCSLAPGSYALIVEGVSGSLVSQATVNISVSSCSAASLNFFSSTIFWWIFFGGIIGLLTLIPLLFLLFRRQNTAVVPVSPPVVDAAAVPLVMPPPPPPPLTIPFPRVAYCETCGTALVLVEPYRRYCQNCQKYV